MKSGTTVTKTKVPCHGRSRCKNHSHTVRHVYLTTVTVLSMWQTQCFILCRHQRTYSHFQTKTPCHFVTQSIKRTSHVVHFQSEKQKSSVYFAARGRL